MRRSLVLMIALALAACQFLQTATAPALAANPNVGYVDFSFGSAPGSAPTADKPQSKLWFNDGAWWSVMFHAASNTWHIYRLTWPDQWGVTGTVVDDRPRAHADCLWDGTHLYVATTLSNVETSASNEGRLYRYSYTSGIYTLDPGFPAVMMTGSIESLAIDKDTTGKLWITFTKGSQVYVNRSTTDDATWGTPFVVPGPTSATTVYPDDISSLVAYHDQNGNSIGVLWSNHDPNHPAPTSMYFTYHKDSDPDDVWQPIEAIYTAMCAADDHINLKSLQSDPSGAIYAAVKTSFGDSGCGGSSSSPLIRLVVRKPNNSWSVTTFGTVGDDHTRPLVLLDTTNRKVYMFATSQTTCGVSAIYMKSTSMDNPDFSNQPGKGTPFISSSTYTCINNATSTKQTVNAATGLVVLASDKNQQYYLHNVLALGSPPPDTTPPTVTNKTPAAGATGVDGSTNVTASFSEAVTGVSGSSMTLTAAGDSTPVPAAVSYSSATRTATLNPNANLAPSTTYTVVLGSSIADTAGNPLAPVSWSFTTAGPPPDTTPPTVTNKTPAAGASGVDPAATITATFSEDLNAATVNVGSVTLAKAGAGSVPAAVTYDAASRTVTLNPDASLEAGATYTAQLSGVITDLAGNPLAPVSWSFTTAGPPPDTTPPTVTNKTPAAGASGVDLAATITATFSEPIDSATITGSSFTLMVGGTAVAATVSYNAATQTATLTPGAALAYGTTYIAQISGVKDLAGNALAAPATWSFTTAAAPAPEQQPVFIPIVLR